MYVVFFFVSSCQESLRFTSFFSFNKHCLHYWSTSAYTCSTQNNLVEIHRK